MCRFIANIFISHETGSGIWTWKLTVLAVESTQSTYDQNNNIPATVPCAKWNTLSLAFLPFFLLKVIIENIAKSFNVYRKERLLQLAIFIRKTVFSLCNNITIFNKFVKLKCE